MAMLHNTSSRPPVVSSSGISPQQLRRNVKLYSDRYSLFRGCVNEWVRLQSAGTKQLPGYCIPDDIIFDPISVDAIVGYDLTGQQESETNEEHLSRWKAILLMQENLSGARRTIASNNQKRRLKPRKHTEM